VSRGRQDLVIYHRPPFQVVSIDDSGAFYEPWTEDVDEDEVQERFRWERRPLEVVFELAAGGPRIRLVLVHTKSKGVSTSSTSPASRTSRSGTARSSRPRRGAFANGSMLSSPPRTRSRPSSSAT